MTVSEYQNVRHPARTYVQWALFYVAIIIAILAGLYWLGTTLRAYTIPEGTVELDIPYSKYLVGETITFSVKNNFTSSVTILNDCPEEPLAVYRKESGAWKRIHTEASIVCSESMRTIVLKPGETRTGSFAHWKKLFTTPGNYRVALFVEYFDTVSYQDFEVIKKPVVKKVTTPAPVTVTPAPAAPAPVVTTPTQSHEQEHEDEDEHESPFEDD